MRRAVLVGDPDQLEKLGAEYERRPDVSVVATSSASAIVLAKIARHRPDLVVMHGGIGPKSYSRLERQIREAAPKVEVIRSEGRQNDTRDRLERLQLGALSRSTSRRVDAAEKTQTRIQRLAARVRHSSAAPYSADMVVVAASTGGPEAICQFLQGLGPVYCPVIIVLHVAVDAHDRIVTQVERRIGVDLTSPIEPTRLLGDETILAAPGFHLMIQQRRGKAFAIPVEEEPLHGTIPAADPLFSSAAESYREKLVGVVLTGMGNDGLEGARAIAAMGGRVFAQAPPSAVAPGMPGAVVEAGIALEALEPAALGARVRLALHETWDRPLELSRSDVRGATTLSANAGPHA